MTSTNMIKTSRRRTFSLEDSKLHQKCDVGTLKKSLSSTLKIPNNSGISNCDVSNEVDSMEDLNREIENLCPFNPLLPHQFKVANSRYCDIFSRQSIESDENSSPDEETRINFLATIPQVGHPGCDVLQLVPKKPVVSSEQNAMYQPCTNTIIQLKQSSFSAFREMKNQKQPSEDDKKKDVAAADDEDDDDNAGACAVSSRSSTQEDER